MAPAERRRIRGEHETAPKARSRTVALRKAGVPGRSAKIQSPASLADSALDQPPQILARPRGPLSIHTLDAFRYRNYRFLWASVLWVSSGYGLQQVVIGWLIYDITRSAFLTSITLGLEAIPLLLAGPLGGFLADVFDRRKLIVGTYLYQGSLVMAFGLVVLLWKVGPLAIFAFVVLAGFSWVTSEPARSSIIANTVPKEGLINAFALSVLGFGGTRLVVPAIGGVLLAVYGPGTALVSQACLIFAAAACASMIRLRDETRERPQLSQVITGLLEGVAYVRHNRVVLALLIFGLTSPLILFPFVIGLMPVYAAEVYDVGPRGLGLLISGTGLGMVSGTIIMASIGDPRAKGKLIIGAVVLSAVGMAAYSQAHWFFAIVIFLGVSTPVLYTTIQATIQSIIPDYLRGRISGLTLMTWGALPVGSLMAGALAQTLGVQSATLVGALLLAAMLPAQLLTFRFMWHLE